MSQDQENRLQALEARYAETNRRLEIAEGRADAAELVLAAIGVAAVEIPDLFAGVQKALNFERGTSLATNIPEARLEGADFTGKYVLSRMVAEINRRYPHGK